MSSDQIFGLIAVLFVFFWAARTLKKMFKEPLTVHREIIVTKRENKKPKYFDFKGKGWLWPATRKSESGDDMPAPNAIGEILLQEIRDNQDDILKAMKANTKEVKALRMYLQQVFGGVDGQKD